MQKKEKALIKLSLRQEIEREAERIEEEIAQRPELDQIQVTEEMDKVLLEKIRAYEEEVEEERQVAERVEELKESRGLRDGLADNADVDEEENRDSGAKGTFGADRYYRESEDHVEFSEELMPDLDAWRAQSGGERKEVAGEDEKGKVVYRRKKRKYWVISLAAVLVIVLGVGMNSVGSKSYWKTLWEKLVGEEAVNFVDVEDMDKQNTEDANEVLAYKDIKAKLDINPVRLLEKPDDMKLVDYKIYEEILAAQLLYKYQSEIIRYTLYIGDKDSSWGQKQTDNKVNEYTVSVNEIEIKVEEFQVLDNSENRQIANFEYQGIHYQLKGVMERSKFEEILKNLFFL